MNPATLKKLQSLKSVEVSSNVEVKQVNKPIKEKKQVKPKETKCYIHIASLKEYPKILINQLRFEWFDSLEECEGWCKEHCLTYEIRDQKGNTIIKKK
jgi:hypothetical protein